MTHVVDVARNEDLPAIESILRRTGVFTDEEVQVAMELAEEAVNPAPDTTYRIAVTRSDGRVSGYILWGRTWFTKWSYDLYWMAVDPDVQRGGLGTMLVREMERAMRAEGGRIVRIETSSLPEYEKTRAFYRRVGYPETLRVPDFYWEGNDLCLHFGEIPRD
jgi:ribosomal protein S18 acetylase RimI-like enzyme